RHTSFSRDWSSDVCSSDLIISLFTLAKTWFSCCNCAVSESLFNILLELFYQLPLAPPPPKLPPPKPPNPPPPKPPPPPPNPPPRSEERRVGNEPTPRARAA